MKTIQNLTDIDNLKSCFPVAFVNYLEKYYLEIKETLQNYDNDPEEFSMEKYNRFIILESGDSLLTVPDIGVCEDDGDIFGCFEFVNVISIDDISGANLRVFCGGILVDNEYMILIFAIEGVLSMREEAFLKEFAIDEKMEE